jgi:hypothetical protein
VLASGACIVCLQSATWHVPCTPVLLLLSAIQRRPPPWLTLAGRSHPTGTGNKTIDAFYDIRCALVAITLLQTFDKVQRRLQKFHFLKNRAKTLLNTCALVFVTYSFDNTIIMMTVNPEKINILCNLHVATTQNNICNNDSNAATSNQVHSDAYFHAHTEPVSSIHDLDT